MTGKKIKEIIALAESGEILVQSMAKIFEHEGFKADDCLGLEASAYEDPQIVVRWFVGQGISMAYDASAAIGWNSWFYTADKYIKDDFVLEVPNLLKMDEGLFDL